MVTVERRGVWGCLRSFVVGGPILIVVTTKVKDECNKLGRVSPMSRRKRVVVSFSVFSTGHTKFRGIMFVVGGRGRTSFGRTIKGEVRGVVSMTCMFRSLGGLPRNCRIPRKHMGP